MRLLGGTTPLLGSNASTGLPPPPPPPGASYVVRSKPKPKGMCSLLASITVSREREPTSTLPKLMLATSNATAGSTTCPTSMNGTAISCSTMRKVKKLSAISSLSGVYSNTISYFFPAAMTPRWVMHRNADAAAAELNSSPGGTPLTGSHANSYATEVGLSTMNRLVLRTLVPKDSNSTVLVAGSSAPSRPAGPKSPGSRRPADR
mmetsp:Transcript_12125/g.19568  ORF Transcript_12125/g.19568 Transcript_12125/m.19568 type:complete len:205 (-) Transcript_12125:632-1246(-)